ncbi:cuticle protein 19 [Calliphora vicina]|uniref:cuticle protein 19 n=1 Tax=Calliphora vicina TaxID=7373 RepID=UPI00325B6BCE
MLALTIVMLLLLITRKSLGLVNPLYTEYYANYRNYPDDDKLNYKFHYFIDHPPSKVHMMHLEERQGDRVMGQYGLLEPNGMVRMVHYQVVGDSGFQSVVQTRTPHSTTHIRLTNRKQPKLPIILQQPVASVI